MRAGASRARSSCRWWKRGGAGIADAIVMPIDVGERRSVAAEFARRYSLGNVALDPRSTARALFGVQGFPTMVVVDSTGHIRAKWEGLNPAIDFALTNAESAL